MNRTLTLLAFAAAACSTARPAPPVRVQRTPSPAIERARTRAPVPPGLVDIDQAMIVRLRYATADNFTGAKLPGYEANRALLRPAAATALLRAQRRLEPKGLSIVVLDAYRPVRATNAMVAWARRSGRPELVGPYIATRSAHNRGTAVDVTLARARDGTELDMGTPFDTFGPRAHYRSAAGPAFALRRTLREAMSGSGFAPYDTEWWHFSLGDGSAPPLDIPIRADATRPLIERIHGIRSATQVVLVEADPREVTRASLSAFQRTGDRWHAIINPTRAFLGVHGFAAAKREGDGRTPVGIYELETMFGTEPDPGVLFSYRRTTPRDVWVDDPKSALYNTLQQDPPNGRWAHAEKLYQSRPYAHAQVIAYNAARTPGRGSAIFLHVSTGRPTVGCVSIDKAQLVSLLRRLDPSRHPVIAMGPRSFLDRS